MVAEMIRPVVEPSPKGDIGRSVPKDGVIEFSRVRLAPTMLALNWTNGSSPKFQARVLAKHERDLQTFRSRCSQITSPNSLSNAPVVGKAKVCVMKSFPASTELERMSPPAAKIFP